MSFEFATANRILFGPGQFGELPELARKHGRSALLVIGSSSERSDALRRHLIARGVSITPFHVRGEPTMELANEGAAQTRYHTCDSVIGFGGGSVIDAAKAIAALATNRRPVIDYVEVIGKAQPLLVPPLPMIAVPTTAGAGAEVTRNSVLTASDAKLKISLRHRLMLPAIALVDPELTYSLPPRLTAATGMDALSQLIEPFVSNRANPLTDAICREGISQAAGSLQRAFKAGSDGQARRAMSLASLFGGLALANAGLGAVHGFAAPLGAMFNAPHGAICAALLAPVMRVNIRSIQNAEKFEEIARRLTGNPAARAKDGVTFIENLTRDLEIPKLSSHGIAREDFPQIIAKAKNASSMRANPAPLSDADLDEILSLAL